MSLQRRQKGIKLGYLVCSDLGERTVNEAKLRELSKSMADQFAKSLIRQGLIDPQNKSEAEIERDAASYIAEIVAGRVSLVFVTDHRDDLGAKAREFLDAGELDLACLLYSTWIEHWFNGLVVVVGEHYGLPRQDIAQMVRDLGLRAKAGWFLKITGLEPIADEHRDRIFAIFEQRNAFVHYKWKGLAEDEEMRERQALRDLLEQADFTLKHLLEYEDAYLYGRETEPQ
jgi:hypothetical protein